MPKNVGKMDKMVRILVAIILLIIVFTVKMSSLFTWMLGIVAVILAATAALGTCMLYVPFKINTNKGNGSDPEPIKPEDALDL